MNLNLKQHLRQLEIELIKKALSKSCSIAGAARKLGLNRTTLLMKMKRFDIEVYRPTPMKLKPKDDNNGSTE